MILLRADCEVINKEAEMAGIPESQLETWARQGGTVTAKATHEAIRSALSRYNGWPRDIDYEVYLQGSYRNDTNIRGDSDVDLVIQLNPTFQYDLTSLSEYERNLFDQTFSNVDYGWSEFRADTLKALQNWYGSSDVSEGKNCLTVKGDTNRLSADVLVCLQYRDYQNFNGRYNQKYVEGVKFFSWNGNRWVVNYPKPHYDNGVRKNAQFVTNGWFKQTVRMFKNARIYLINQNTISEDLAPSYFLQCLLYNVPNRLFGGSYNRTFLNILNWLYETEFSDEVCQNEQIYLFRGGTPEQWTINSANRFTREVIDLWNNW